MSKNKFTSVFVNRAVQMGYVNYQKCLIEYLQKEIKNSGRGIVLKCQLHDEIILLNCLDDDIKWVKSKVNEFNLLRMKGEL